MDRDELLKSIEALGKEFRRRGMTEHLRRLRVYYLAVRRGLTEGDNSKVSCTWSADLVRQSLEELLTADVTTEAKQLRRSMEKGSGLVWNGKGYR